MQFKSKTLGPNLICTSLDVPTALLLHENGVFKRRVPVPSIILTAIYPAAYASADEVCKGGIAVVG